MRTRKETKHQAQDELLAGMANVILAHEEGNFGDDEGLVAEMRAQARRVMRFLGVDEYPGLGRTD